MPKILPGERLPILAALAATTFISPQNLYETLHKIDEEAQLLARDFTDPGCTPLGFAGQRDDAMQAMANALGILTIPTGFVPSSADRKPLGFVGQQDGAIQAMVEAKEPGPMLDQSEALVAEIGGMSGLLEYATRYDTARRERDGRREFNLDSEKLLDLDDPTLRYPDVSDG